MCTISKRMMQGGLLATLGLGALSPVQQAGLALSAGAAALWATPALASQTLPGVGIVIKKKPGNAPIIAPTDSNGALSLSGLEPGEYEVKLLGDTAPVTMTVGRDGMLATVAQEDRGRRWVELIPAGDRRRASISAYFVGNPLLAMVLTRSAGSPEIIDVNTATPEALMRGTGNTREAAAFIVSERQRGGPYKSGLDFAQRVGPRVTADFSAVAVRFGDTTIFPRGGDPKSAGFKTAAGSGAVELYGQRYDMRVLQFGAKFNF